MKETLGGSGQSKLTGTSEKLAQSGGSAGAGGHEAPLVKTVFSAGLQQSKPYVDVFSSQVRSSPHAADAATRYHPFLPARNAVPPRRARTRRPGGSFGGSSTRQTSPGLMARTPTNASRPRCAARGECTAQLGHRDCPVAPAPADAAHPMHTICCEQKGVKRQYDSISRGLFITVTSHANLPKAPLRLNLVHKYIVFQCMVPAKTSGFRCSLVMTDTNGSEKCIFFSSMLKNALLNNPLRKCLPLPLQTDVWMNLVSPLSAGVAVACAPKARLAPVSWVCPLCVCACARQYRRAGLRMPAPKWRALNWRRRGAGDPSP